MRKLTAGTVYYLDAESRDLGHGSESICGEYVWTGQIDTWGKYTLRSTDGGPTLYLFADEIVSIEPVYPVGGRFSPWSPFASASDGHSNIRRDEL